MRNIKKFSLLFLFIIIFLLSSCVKKIEDVNATTTIYSYIEDTTQERKVDNTISQDDTTVVTEKESSVDENELELIEEETTSVEFEKSDINENNVNENNIDKSINQYKNTNDVKFSSGNVHLDQYGAINLNDWQYGMTPIEWIFVEPNTQLISNNHPNTSPKFSIKTKSSWMFFTNIY